MTDDTKQPTSTEKIEKLSTVMERLLNERKTKMREADDARAILQDAATVFDHEAAARLSAQARVADLVNGTSAADGIEAEFEQKRLTTEKANAALGQRQARAGKQLEDASRLVQALTTQAVEIDSAIRSELAAASCELEADAEQALAELAAKFLKAYVNYKATVWLRFTERPGEGRKQFVFPDQYEVTLSVPPSVVGELPGGHHQGFGEAIIYAGFEVRRFINDRVREIMGEQSGGLYPRIGAGLNIEEG